MDKSLVKNVIKIMIITVAVYLTLKYLLPLFVPFIIAYLIAIILKPVVRFLHKKIHFPLVFVSIVVVAAFMCLFGIFIFYLGKMGFMQLSELAGKVPDYKKEVMGYVDDVCCMLDGLVGEKDGSAKGMLLGLGNSGGVAGKEIFMSLTKMTIDVCTHVALFLGFMLVVFVSSVLLIIELVRDEKLLTGDMFDNIKKDFVAAGATYLKTQLILMGIVSVICTLGLLLAGSDYALVIGVLTGFLDAFPVLGSGLVLVPYAIISLLKRKIRACIVIAITYVISQVVREFLEPKLLGKGIGIKPLYMIMSMYIGLKLFGVAGFILGPLGLLLIRSLINIADELEALPVEPPEGECED